MKFKSLVPNLGVKDVNATVSFYTEVLGFELLISNPSGGVMEWAMVASGGAAIMFQAEKSLKDEYPMLADRALGGCLTFYVKMNNMTALYEKIKAADHPLAADHLLVKEMHKTFYGADEFAIHDNNGYILTITEDK